MQQLPSGIKDKTNFMQKILAFGLLGAVGYGAVLLLNKIIPPINELLENIWTLILYGLPLALVTLYVVSNPLVIWGFFKTISWKLTSWLIKMDPLSVMDRYVEYLGKKLNNLRGTIITLEGKKVKLKRRMDELNKKCDEHIRLGKAAHKIQNQQAASAYGVKLQTDRNTLSMLAPLYGRIDRSLTFMHRLEENWRYGIEKLEYQIDAKRQEYEIIKETVKGLKSAEDMINSDNEAAKLYGLSLKHLEETVTQQIGYIDEFERRSKDIMNSIDIEKQANHDEGMAELEKYLLNDSLKFDISNSAEDVIFEILETKHQQGNTKFNLLNKNKT